MTDFYTPEIGNKRLENCVFLQTSDMLFWDRLVLEINQLTHDGESIPVPAPEEMGAWQRAFILYERLRDRAAAARPAQQDPALQSDQREWDDYVNSRDQVLQMLQRGILDRDTLVEHLDVLPGDLDPPMPATPVVRPHDPWCPIMETGKTADCTCIGRIPEDRKAERHPEWRSRAARLSAALRWFGGMTAEERQVLRTQRVLRRLETFKEDRAR